MSKLNIREATVVLEETTVLANLNLQLDKGEIGVVLGESGVGKTTLLKLIAGQLQPTAGAVFWGDERIKGPLEVLIPGHAGIKLVAQDFDLMPVLSAKENIIQGMPGRAESTQSKKANELLKAFKLTELAHQKVKLLSGGQQQRVALAKALAANVKLLLFDEVFSQLDLATKMEVMVDLKHYLKSRKKTALFVLHNALDTFYLADKLFILQNKKVVQSGSPKEVSSQPANLSIAQLFGYVNVVSNYIAEKYFPNVTVHQQGKNVWFRPTAIKRADIKGVYKLVDEFTTERSTVYIAEVGKTSIWIEEPFTSGANQ